MEFDPDAPPFWEENGGRITELMKAQRRSEEIIKSNLREMIHRLFLLEHGKLNDSDERSIEIKQLRERIKELGGKPLEPMHHTEAIGYSGSTESQAKRISRSNKNK